MSTSLKAAQASIEGTGPTVEHFGRGWKLPSSMPYAVIDAFASDTPTAMRRALVQLVGEKEYESLVDSAPGRDDMVAFLMKAHAAYDGGSDPEA